MYSSNVLFVNGIFKCAVSSMRFSSFQCGREKRCPTVEGRPGKLLHLVWWLIPIAVHTGVEDETKIKRNPCTLCHQLHCVCVPIALCVISCMQRRITALWPCDILIWDSTAAGSLPNMARTYTHTLTMCDALTLTMRDTLILKILQYAIHSLLQCAIQCTLKAREQGSIQ